MTHKSFYEAAAAEVAAGHLDNALWIKVNAEMADADNGARQARYITLRAQEMAVEAAAYKVRRWMPHSVGTWVLYLAVVIVAATVVADLLAGMGAMGQTPLPVFAFAVVVIGATVFAIRHSRAANDADRPAAAPSSTRAK